MTTIGILLMLVGGGAAIYGLQLNNSVEAQLNSLFGSGSANPGTVWIVVGIIVAAIGLALLFKGLHGRNDDSN